MPVIALHIEYARLPGADGKPLGLDCAVFLSQAAYWTRIAPDGFYKSRAEWQEETTLSRFQQESVRARLVAAGLLCEWQEGCPPCLHYRVNMAILEAAVSALAIGKTAQVKTSAPVKHRLETDQSVGEKLTKHRLETDQSVGEKLTNHRLETDQSVGEKLTNHRLETDQSIGEKLTKHRLETDQSHIMYAPGIPEITTETTTESTTESTAQAPAQDKPAPERKTRSAFILPSWQEAKGYFCEKGGSDEDEAAWRDYWLQRDWKNKDGRKMADWQAAARQWLRHKAQFAAPSAAVRGSPALAPAGRKADNELTIEERMERNREWMQK